MGFAGLSQCIANMVPSLPPHLLPANPLLAVMIRALLQKKEMPALALQSGRQRQVLLRPHKLLPRHV